MNAFGWEEHNYKKLFNESLEYGYFYKDGLKYDFGARFILLNDCNKKDLNDNIEKIKKKYIYNNIILCISAHGGNASGIALFYTPQNEQIFLSDIIKKFSTKSLLNITILLDLCRTGEFKDESKVYKFLDSIEDKRVAIMTASWRGEAAIDTKKGGYLIQSLVNSINNDFNNFILSLFSFEYHILLIKNTIEKFLNIRLATQNLNIDKWKKLLEYKKRPEFWNITVFRNHIEQICKKSPSIYFNKKARQYLEKLKIKESFLGLLKLICRDYIDINATIAIKKITSTKIRK